MASSSPSNVPVVLITGFGPFRSVLVNPSWEVAKALQTHLEWNSPVQIITENIPVTYDDVSARIPEHWLKYNPTLVVHMGVSVGSKEVQIERCACNVNYCHMDNNGTLPESGRCIKAEAPQTLTTLLPIDEICARVQSRTHLPVSVSNDAGRFLCEYIYYQSLFIDPKRTVFIHVPQLDQQFTVENLARAIQLIIYELLPYVQPVANFNKEESYLINPSVVRNREELNLNFFS